MADGKGTNIYKFPQFTTATGFGLCGKVRVANGDDSIELHIDSEMIKFINVTHQGVWANEDSVQQISLLESLTH